MHPVPENKVVSLEERAKDEQKPFLEQLLQEGARKLLQAAIENEVIDYIQFHKDRRDEDGQRLVVRNGHLPSGTSGMKAALNGVPSLSVLDGWWIEGCIEGTTGWAIDFTAPA